MTHSEPFPLHQPSSQKVVRPRFAISYALFFTIAVSVLTVAQAPGTGSTMVPIPGVGHDYIQDFSETVDPSSGSVSLRIGVPIPKGRGLNLPFSFAYDSNGVVYPPSWTFYHATGLASDGGWSYTIPASAADVATFNPPDFPMDTCQYYTNFRFEDSSGARRGLGFLKLINPSTQCGTNPATQSGGDIDFRATLSSSILAADANGTVYSLPGGLGGLATKVEDRNGNVINISGSGTQTDTLGRIALSVSGFGETGNTVAVAGLGASYQLTWETVSADFTVDSTLVFNGSDYACSYQASPPSPISELVVKSIQLPNGKSYTFMHGTDDPNNSNPYGLLSQITYPSGAWIKYSWTINPQSAGGVFPNIQGQAGQCDWRWGKPALQSRTVSFDGVNPALKQTFQYTTNWPATGSSQSSLWNTKQTIVTTQDLVRGTSFTTTYLYAPAANSGEPAPVYKYGGVTVDPQIPVEQTVTYQDVGGAILKTVNKTWYNAQQLASEQLTVGGVTSQTTYAYGSPGGQLVEEDEYDFGASSPTRKTVTAYQSFGTTPIYTNGPSIFNKPCQIIVSDNTSGSPVRVAETDYFYDNGVTTTPCGTAGAPSVSSAGGSSLTGHDVTNYGVGITSVRGNATALVNQCFVAAHACSGNPTTSYAYDETGQVVSMTDPDTNITNYYYTDSYLSTNTGSYTTTAGSPPSGELTNAYLTKIKNAINFAETFTYGYNDGELTSATDENGQTIEYRYNDNLDRLTETDNPSADGGQTLYAYSDASPLATTTCQLINGTAGAPCIATSPAIGWKTSIATMDGMGHLLQAELVSDPDGPTFIATTYDGEGKPYTVSNPYRTTSDSTYGITTYYYDALGRTCLVVPPSGTAASGSTCPTSAPAGDVFTSYTGRATDVVDEGNGNTNRPEKVSQADAFGRLVSVCEVTGTTLSGPGGTPGSCALDIAKTGFLTTYSYDVLGNLLKVTQGSLGSRTFAYDSLSRLLCAANPETGTTSTGAAPTCPNPDSGSYIGGTTRYAYDANGNLTSRKRPKPNQTNQATVDITTYAYDALNRLSGQSYSDGTTPSVSLSYDQTTVTMGGQQFSVTYPLGRLTSECVAGTSGCASMLAYTYDPMGRMAQLWACQYLNCTAPNVVFTYTYDFFGDETERYVGVGPNGSTQVISSYIGTGGQTAGRLTSYTAATFVDATNPRNLLTGIHYDPFGHVSSGALANGLTESWGYDNRGRLKAMSVGTTCSAGVCTGSTVYSSTLGYTPDSNILSNVDSFNGSWAFTYDDLNRLITSNCSANCPDGTSTQGFSYAYDRYANRWTQTVTAGSGPQPSLTFNGPSSVPNNRIDGYSYDAAGNLLNDGTNSYMYDGENRIASVGSSYTYSYDPEGRRFVKTTGGVTTTFLYDREGHLVIAPNFTELYAAGMHLGTYVINSAKTDTIFYYDHADWLGTERARTNLSGLACETIQSLPFGDGQVIRSLNGGCTPVTDVSPMHFTGKERDSESGLDNFGARYDASSLGRFMSPDPMGGHRQDPQTLNRYAYVRNNPLSLTDPTGLDFYLSCTPANGGTSTCKQMQVGTDKNGKAQMAWVQGVTGNNGFTATQIGNDANGNLVDRTTGTGAYTADVTGSGVQLSNGGTPATGIFLNKDVDLTGTNQIQSYDTVVQGSGNMSEFLFTFTNSKMEANQTAAGFFSFAGTPGQAGDALMKAGFAFHKWGENSGMNEYRSRGSSWTGANSGHFNVDPKADPGATVPTTRGDMHFGEHNPFRLFGWLAHCASDGAGVCE
jgi:RHS repeat-associated protein